MGWMCERVVEAGGTVIADFVCPTDETRNTFGDAFTIICLLFATLHATITFFARRTKRDTP